MLICLLLKLKKALEVRAFGTRSRHRTGTSITGHRILSPARLPIPPSGQQIGKKKRARNGTRTRDPDLGKVVLYQLSYSRNADANV